MLYVNRFCISFLQQMLRKLLVIQSATEKCKDGAWGVWMNLSGNTAVRIVRTLLVGVVLCTISSSLFGMNLLQPIDTLIRPPFYTSEHRNWQTVLFAETGFGFKAFNEDGNCTDPLRIVNSDQNALKMLEGAEPNCPIGQLKAQLFDVNDDGRRGHFCVSSDFKLNFAGAFGLRYSFLRDWTLAVYVPVYSMELKDVCWQDLTPQSDCPDSADARVRKLLTDDFFANVCRLGNLDLQGWKRTGVGDVALMLEWFRRFPQNKPFLKEAHVNWRVGVLLPTGKKNDVDKISAFAFGFDGATSLTFGLSLDLRFKPFFKLGGTVQLFHTFGNTRTRRVQTHVAQTNLLMLTKARVFKDFGLTQMFSLYAQLYRPIGGLSFRVGYQYIKNGDDILSIECPDFADSVANTARGLEDFTMHHMITEARYDLDPHLAEDTRAIPRFSVFLRLPFNGKRVILAKTVGFTFAVDF